MSDPTYLRGGIRTDGPLARKHRVNVVGSGDEVIVLSHGLGTDQGAWREIVPALTDRFTVVLYDLPGAGPLLPEDFHPSNYTEISAFADDMLSLLDELGIERCCYLGHSVSGMIGVLAAIEAPSKFDQLVLLAASPRYLDEEGYVGGFRQEDLDTLFEAMTSNYQAWVAGFAPHAIGDNVPAAVSQFSSGLLAMRPDVTARIARMIFQSDVRSLLPLLQVPTLLIHSRNDIAVPEAVAHYLHAHMSSSTLVWIDAPGHLPHLSAPDQVKAILRAHVG
ncbi:alpha/beta fold hydrolase [Sphingomonas mucosissima]|uniref:Sigma factor SigB regulation protein RsbQ n=1 Tax=Sphingomonas mucosissima TaxID=370959 RepID=A0A245ZPX5_9SPHN|nr:alpha/beta hydrolase [Sphingomonas mucosissima]OWK31779.1 sigma factor SigB regulation protein RsbQ [Sphingomonas mucosissima]